MPGAQDAGPQGGAPQADLLGGNSLMSNSLRVEAGGNIGGVSGKSLTGAYMAGVGSRTKLENSSGGLKDVLTLNGGSQSNK